MAKSDRPWWDILGGILGAWFRPLWAKVTGGLALAAMAVKTFAPDSPVSRFSLLDHLPESNWFKLSLLLAVLLIAVTVGSIKEIRSIERQAEADRARYDYNIDQDKIRLGRILAEGTNWLAATQVCAIERRPGGPLMSPTTGEPIISIPFNEIQEGVTRWKDSAHQVIQLTYGESEAAIFASDDGLTEEIVGPLPFDASIAPDERYMYRFIQRRNLRVMQLLERGHPRSGPRSSDR